GLARFVATLVHKAGLPSKLAECGVERTKLPQLAADAAKQWTSQFNPRAVDVPDLLGLYEEAF
ncbi:MAG TPA: iron-containing alcohol dehydrogenase, partial [Pirellulales bacterium]|nr:iron-containing alcohol dehydrogenase [Pirellulales bacterium]